MPREGEGRDTQARANSRPNEPAPAFADAFAIAGPAPQPSDERVQLIGLKEMPSTALARSPSALPPTPTQTLRLAPTAGKFLALLLLLLNAGSSPLVWYLRVFSSVIEVHVAFRLVWLRHRLSSKEERAAALEARHDARMPVGVHPFRKVWTYASWVSFDDSEFNLHMNNSSYAKALDSARFRLALATFPNIFRRGGWVPLAGACLALLFFVPELLLGGVLLNVVRPSDTLSLRPPRPPRPRPPDSHRNAEGRHERTSSRSAAEHSDTAPAVPIAGVIGQNPS
ncbi:hypothetical protein FB451DRAFT_1400737 [Mycena latifolia]|nr:hypothetical protein FB451DRAFT_1400737 [Mycena latifolia]